LTQSVLDALRSRITAFEQLVVAPREGVARTAALTILIEAEVERGMELLRGFFDRIMYRFKESDAEFYTNYQTARKVIRPSYRSQGEETEESEDGAKTSSAKTSGGSSKGKATKATDAAEAPAQPAVVNESEEATYAEVEAVLGDQAEESSGRVTAKEGSELAG